MFYKDLINLNNTEIIDLLTIIYWPLKGSEDFDIQTKIEIKSQNYDNCGFSYKITTQDFEDEEITTRVYTGICYGHNDFLIDSKDPYITEGFSIKEVYNHLNNIGFFQSSEKEFKPNRFIQNHWNTILDAKIDRIQY